MFNRSLQLQNFLTAQGCEQLNLNCLNGDASFRHYYRAPLSMKEIEQLCNAHGVSLNVKTHINSVIVVDSPPDTQKNCEFSKINALLHEANIPVSSIIAQDLENGFFILEDLGDFSFYQVVTKEKVTTGHHKAYDQAIAHLTRISLLPFTPRRQQELNQYLQEQKTTEYKLTEQSFKTLNDLPTFDDAFIKMELNIFNEWLLDKALHLELTSQEQTMLQDTWNFLSTECQHQVQVAMHRDFHSRNLMVCKSAQDAPLTVIDYQDMVKGPLGYDLASFLYDCYLVTPEPLKQELITIAHKQFSLCKLISSDFSINDLAQNIKICALQRHIKVLGLFNRLNLRDGKDGYLKDLPLVLDYVLTNCDSFTQMQPFKQFLITRVKEPLLKMVNSQA